MQCAVCGKLRTSETLTIVNQDHIDTVGIQRNKISLSGIGNLREIGGIFWVAFQKFTVAVYGLVLLIAFGYLIANLFFFGNKPMEVLRCVYSNLQVIFHGERFFTIFTVWFENFDLRASGFLRNFGMTLRALKENGRSYISNCLSNGKGMLASLTVYAFNWKQNVLFLLAFQFAFSFLSSFQSNISAFMKSLRHLVLLWNENITEFSSLAIDKIQILIHQILKKVRDFL